MLKNSETEKIKNVELPHFNGDKWSVINTEELFANKKVILFSLPGAFTPTCSSSHVPRYNQLFKDFKKNGVDEIICVSVNDSFVMNAWKKDQKAENITFLADGNGDFTESMGLLVDKQNLGFGKRSWRYSMLVDNGTITKMFIEPEKDGDPFEVSDADTMIQYLNPTYKIQESISIITKETCPFCKKAKALLAKKGLEFEEIVLGKDASVVSLQAISGKHTVPQVFIGGKSIGGLESLEKHLGE